MQGRYMTTVMGPKRSLGARAGVIGLLSNGRRIKSPGVSYLRVLRIGERGQALDAGLRVRLVWFLPAPSFNELPLHHLVR